MLSFRTYNNHFIDVDKMVFYVLPYIGTCFFGLCHYFNEVLPKFIPQQRAQISRTPTFHIIKYT